MRYAAIKNKKIQFITDKFIINEEYDLIKIPRELDYISSKDLILDFQYINDIFHSKSLKKKISQMKIAFVSNYGSRCGIGTYSKFLFDEIIKHVGEYKLFSENEDLWKRGESLYNLAKQIKEYNPDIVFIQHEFGIFPNARYWLSFMSQLSEHRVIVTMHSVFYHQDKTIVEAAIPEIVVHSEGAKQVLKEIKKIPGKVYVIPHGCFPCINRNKLWNFYKTDKTFVQFGFGFKYKNWEASIKAAAILKEKYPDVFFTGLFSESDYNKYEHQMYYNELMLLVEKLGLQDNVAIIRGFQSEETLDSYLRTNRIAVFPYAQDPNHICFGVSGAARVAFTKGVPVISSSVHHFQDIPTIKADSPEEIAFQLDLLFNNKELCNAQIERQIQYSNDFSWENVAKMYISIFENQ